MVNKVTTEERTMQTHVSNKRGPGDVPLVGGEQEDVRTGRVHLVTFTRVDGLLLDRLDLKGLELLVKHLTLRYSPHVRAVS